MKTVVLYFTDHEPIRVTADPFFCSLQIANAKFYPGYVSWEEVR